MVTRWGISAAFGVLLSPAAGLAQQAPVPLYPGAMPKTYEAQPLPPVPSAPDYAAPAAPQPPPYAGGMPPMPRSPLPPPMSAPPMSSPPMSSPAAAMPAPLFPPAPQPSTTGAPVSPSADRTFCSQPVSIHVANRDTVGQRYQPFIGIWSDASWTPSLCAALIVENVTPDGTATIVYAFRPDGVEHPRTGRRAARHRRRPRRRVALPEFGWQPIQLSPAILRPGRTLDDAARSDPWGRVQAQPLSAPGFLRRL